MGVKCPKCQHENPDDTIFCGKCGTKFPSLEEAEVTETLKTPLKGFAKGTTIAGKYKIIELLGRGGMGVVYKAEDIKLKRTVALKFLAPELTCEKEAKERFILEAQTASALNHPNICTVHEIDESEGQMFIAMAFIEGQSLRERIAKGPFKLQEALEVATQIASGLHEAHEKGIVHRDIKSSNIMITSKGQAMIMDFGIAKLAGGTRITRTGATMGTVAYMSPEQARGEKIDHRTDIWSLGVVLFEMVIGQLPFKGDHEQAVVYSVLNEEPEPMTGLRAKVPMELERIVSKMLTKDPAERFQHSDDLMVDLKAIKKSPYSISSISRTMTAAPETLQPTRGKWAFLWGFAGLILGTVAGVTILSLMRSTPQEHRPVSRLTVSLPPNQQLLPNDIAISPDGTHLIYQAQSNGPPQLHIRTLDEFEGRAIPGAENGDDPFFSPDGQWIGFHSEPDSKIKKVSVTGGTPQAICDCISLSSATWGTDDHIIFSSNSVGAGLMRVPSSGGIPNALTTPNTEKGELGHHWPLCLPDNNSVLFTINTREGWRFAVLSLESGEWRMLRQIGSVRNAVYIPSGHLVYSQTRELLAVPFDLAKLEMTGSPLLIMDNIPFSGTMGRVFFTASSSGSLVYISGPGAFASNDLVWVDRQGRETPLIKEVNSYSLPRLSPDGKRLAVIITEWPNWDIWIYDIARETRTRLTHGGINVFPVWNPDGKWVTFGSDRAGQLDIYCVPADGRPEEKWTLESDMGHAPSSWSPDGRLLAFHERHPKTGRDIWVLTNEGNRPTSPFIVTPFNERAAIFSPNGRFLAYVSDESGQDEVYVQSYPGPGRKWTVSTSGGREPVWLADGKELFYRVGDRMMVVPVETENDFKAGKPQLLFEGRYEMALGGQNYDVSSDGQRFLMVKSDADLSQIQLQVVLNWIEELKRLVPSGK